MSCAFTQKIVKMSKMLLSLGHEVILYGAESSDAPCTEFVQTHTMKEIRGEWGQGDNRPECDGLGYQWRKVGFRHDFNKDRTDTTRKYYANCIAGINQRKRDDDFLLIMQGYYHKPIGDVVQLPLTLEPGIGYRGSYSKWRAFESAYLQNFTYGSESPRQSVNGRYYDRVIPNYFDGKDFPFQPDKEDFFLYVGRLILRKGVDTAVKAMDAMGGKLVIAGQGKPSDCLQEPEIRSKNWDFIGYIEPDKRAELMGKAKAVFVPTKYLEAFGGVNVEAQLCGTPVITTNFGVFPETVLDGITGFRCNTLQDFVDAARKVGDLNPEFIRAHAEQYLMDNVRHKFNRWFHDLYQWYLSTQTGDPRGGWHHYD
jgi:glycosyltransferase involved in cell wall biosynthesis